MSKTKLQTIYTYKFDHLRLTINLLIMPLIAHLLQKNKEKVFQVLFCTLFMESSIFAHLRLLFVIPIRSLHGSSQLLVYQALKRKSIT